jgi:hypothetical protein
MGGLADDFPLGTIGKQPVITGAINAIPNLWDIAQCG